MVVSRVVAEARYLLKCHLATQDAKTTHRNPLKSLQSKKEAVPPMTLLLICEIRRDSWLGISIVIEKKGLRGKSTIKGYK